MELATEDVDILVQAANVLLHSPEVRRMNTFLQHGKTSCLQHSLAVAYVSLCLRQRFRWHVDRVSLIRGALLHDFFLYDWHEKNAGHRFHGWTHPAAALRNAAQRFRLNATEQNIIASHMWPFTLRRLPRSREAILVNLSDKICSTREIFQARPYPAMFRLLQSHHLAWAEAAFS